MVLQREVYNKLFSKKNGLRDYIRKVNLLEVTEFICKVMADRIFTKEELAHELGVNENYIISILDGNPEMTIKELSDILFVMGMKLNLQTGVTQIASASHIDPKLIDKAKAFQKSE